MFGPARIYSADIETDTSGGGGLDPNGARITEIAISVDETLGGGEVFALEEDSDEAEIALLVAADSYIRKLPPGLLSTWNGSVFDLPFIDDRRKLIAPFLDLGVRLQYDPQIKPKYEPLPGHEGGYSAIWETMPGSLPHQHLDIAKMFQKVAADLGVSWSLKPVCKALGFDMIELARENVHLYTPEERKAYCLSDTLGTRHLTLGALGLLDPELDWRLRRTA